MRLSNAGAALIESFEGFRSAPYRDTGGVWTIGYGSTKGVNARTKHVTRKQAEDRMKKEIDAEYGAAVNKLKLPLTQHQFDALVSFVYNLGPGVLAADETVGRLLRAHRFVAAANAMLLYDHGKGGVRLAGLTLRRRRERALFLRPDPAAAFFTASELRWIRELDDGKPSAARRKVLIRVMTEQRKAIWRAARETGWDKHNRRARYRSLQVRTS